MSDPRSFPRRLFVILVTGLAVASCSSTNSAFRASDGARDPAQAEPEYIIGPGDSLHVVVWKNDDLTTEVEVRPDGKISIPLVEDMRAVGKTPSKLAADIEQVLSKYIRSPDVTVIVSRFGIGAFGNQIRIVGAGAVKPQAIPYRRGLTLLDVMIEVGLSKYAAGDRAKLVRRVNGKLVETGVKLDRLINRGNLAENLQLLPGDVLIIPEARF